MSRAAVTALVAGLSLVLAFAVAELTGVRAIGGAVLIAAGAWILRRPRGVLVAAVMALCFVASHVAADTLGAWPSVLAAALIGAAAAYALSRRPGTEPYSRPRP